MLEFQPLNFAAIASGGPQETLEVPTTSTTDNTVIRFDGLLFTNLNDPTAAAVSAFAIGVALVLVLGIARFMGLEEFTGF